MKPTSSTPVQGQEGPSRPQSASPLRRRLLQAGAGSLALIAFFGLALFRIYGLETHHASRASILWPERCRSLIPPTATDITLRRDLLDHNATYTVSEKDLAAFLDQRFTHPGGASSSSERSPAKPETWGQTVGPLGWRVTEQTVIYDCFASNGGVHRYYHDTKSGRTYQSSAYW